MRNILLIIFVVGLISCSTKDTSSTTETSDTLIAEKEDLPDKPKDTTTLVVIPPELVKLIDKQNLTPKGNYYKLKLLSDSTFVIEWGKDERKRSTLMDFDFRLAERFHLDWENDKFLALKAWTGSDWWFDLFLPLNSDSSEFIIDNGLAFDPKKSLVVCEYPSPDTVMAIHNLVTKNSQFIIEKNECGSALTHYCIDTIAFTKKGLYYRWTLPHKLDGNKKYFERKVVVKI